jgi:V8-like Glu-specific endopeptidase
MLPPVSTCNSDRVHVRRFGNLVTPGQVLTLLRVTPGGLAYKAQVTVPDVADTTSSALQELLPGAADPDKIAAALAALAKPMQDTGTPSDHSASTRLPSGTAPTIDKAGTGSSDGGASTSSSSADSSSLSGKIWNWLSEFYSSSKAGAREAAAADADSVRQQAGSSSSSSRPGGRRLQLVLGDDARVTCPIKYPYTATGEMIGFDGAGRYVCTGTLFKSDRVITAAHCVYDFKNQAFSKALNFAPGRMLDSNDTIISPFGEHNWVYATFLAGYLNSNGTDYDMAVVKLASRVGETVGWLGLRPNNCSQLQRRNSSLSMSGYPGDMPEGSCWTDKCSVRLPGCNSTRLEHQCDTYPGQSGAGMWEMEPGDDAKAYVRAVHVRGYSTYNEATLITPEIFSQVSAW